MNCLAGGMLLTKLKPCKVQRKPIPGLTWSACGFATRAISATDKVSLAGISLWSAVDPKCSRNTTGEPNQYD